MKKLWKGFLRILLLLLVVGGVILGVYVKAGYDKYQEAIEAKPIATMVEEVEAKENYTKLEEVPKIYKDAVVAVEDHRFYLHRGIDFWAIIRAILTNLKKGDLVEGGSTISQQLCKNVYFTQERKLERKIAEVFLAVELEKTLEKDKILELYLNTSFYGNNCDTLKEASRLYFQKEPMELTDFEATMIAGIPNAPSLYNPIYSLTLAQQRQKQVLMAMNRYGYLSEEEEQAILDQQTEVVEEVTEEDGIQES